ncbi:MAG: LiaF-related protein [Anaerolineae bacterium]|nr:LiaF-related protein [Anaerolineae bacterium]
MAGKVLTYDLSVPLGSATSAKVEVSAGTGNLTIDRLSSGEQVLASGTLEYLEKESPPAWTVASDGAEAIVTLRRRGIGWPRFRLPWSACNGASEWRIHLKPDVPCDLTAHSDGGNLKLNLVGMAVTRLSADTGGGNVDVVLPDNAADLGAALKTGAGNVTLEIGSGIAGSNTVSAESGAGNVTVRLPVGVAVKVHATSGLGKVIVDSRLKQADRNTYQSPGYEGAADRVEMTLKSGAGNVCVNVK